MQYYSDNMQQVATYWPPGIPNGRGSVDFSGVTPVILPVRWQDVAVLYRDANGEEKTSSAVVFCSQLVANNGYLFLGIDAGNINPQSSGPLYREIRQVQQSPSLDGDVILVKAML